MAREEKGKFVRDWFGRHAEDSFTYSDPSKRLINWDAGMSSYSKFFRRSNDNLKDSAKMLGSMFRVIGVPKSAKFNGTDKGTKTGSNDLNIQIPLSMLKDAEGNYTECDPKTVDAFYGAAIQNAALAAMQTTPEYNATIKARTVSKHTNVRDLLYSVLNTERVDAKLADRFPGYLKFIQKYKDYKFETKYEPVPEDAPAQQRLLDLLMRMLRYPANIKEEEMKEFEQPLKAMEKALKRFGGIPKSSDDCYSMARSLANMVYKYTEPEEPEPPKPPGGGGGSGEEEGKEEGEGSGAGGGMPDPEAKPKTGKSPMSKFELDELAKSMMGAVAPDEGDDSEEAREAMKDFVEDMDEENDAHLDDVSIDNNHPIVFTKAGTDKEQYQRDLAKIDLTKAHVLHKLFARKNKDYDFSMKSMRSGRLDTNKIAEAVQNVPTIYERIGHVKTNKVCIGVLIDESGSMSGSSIQMARQGAIFINEVFRKLPECELFIYGHTADQTSKNETGIMIYREPGFQTDPHALGSVRARCNNRDGHAILAVAKRMRKITKNEGILFVLSDGQPAAYNYHNGKKDTRAKVTKAQALGFQIIQIAINEHIPSAEMFDYFVTMTNISNLPKDLATYMSRKVDKMIKSTISL